MRILRFSNGGDPLYGILENDSDISILNGDPLYSGIQKTGEKVLLKDVRLLAPVIPRSKVVNIGKNYLDHAAEMGGIAPSEPLMFLAPNTAIIGPNETIAWPRISERIDFEGELVIVIGRICKDVPRERVKEVIFGYTIGNDVTARDLQKSDGQWTRAKSFDTFCPIGPWIETEFKPEKQKISAYVADELKQSARLDQMVFDIPTIIAFVTRVMTLLPGDLILTGTPSGIGPMIPGSKVSVAIEGIGELVNMVAK